MTDKDPLQYMSQIVGGKIFGPYKNKSQFRATRKIWYWVLGRKEGAVNLMQRLYPLMSQRRQKQIKRVIAVAKKYPPRGNYYL
jgi:hypothetical protein